MRQKSIRKQVSYSASIPEKNSGRKAVLRYNEVEPNNCRVGKFSVNPKNRDNFKVDMSISWMVTYRFYDDNAKENKQIRRQGMNEFKESKERQCFTKRLIL